MKGRARTHAATVFRGRAAPQPHGGARTAPQQHG